MVVVEVGQIVAEIGEVVANADAEVLVQVAVDTHQEALFGTPVPDIKPAVFGQRMPLGTQVVAHLRRGEGGGRIQPHAGPAAHTHFALATGQLACEFPVLVQLVHAFERKDLRLLVVLGAAQLAQRGQVVQVGIATEHAPPLVVPGPVGESDIALDELRAGQRVELVIGVGIVQPGGDAPALVDLVRQAVGADPLLALFGAGVFAPLQLALPVGIR
ncbi:hypothetical protein AMR41_09415 [Hapalosiphon sp. MRB220]|nr:hypothetical protein AMR41_09415 [Hapalosiphon sp. MRB220]